MALWSRGRVVSRIRSAFALAAFTRAFDVTDDEAEDRAGSVRALRPSERSPRMDAVARGTAQEKVRRDAEIVTDRARGLTWASIAERHGLSARQARTVWTEHCEATGPADPAEALLAVQEAVAQIDQVVEDAALLALSTANDSVKVAALKLRLSALGQRFELQRLVGVLPYDLGWFLYDADTRATAQTIVRVLEEHDTPLEVMRDLQAAFPASAGRNGTLN